MKERENINVTSPHIACLEICKNGTTICCTHGAGGWGVGVTSQILLGVSFGADVNNLANVTIRNSAFLKSSPGIIFSMYN